MSEKKALTAKEMLRYADLRELRGAGKLQHEGEEIKTEFARLGRRLILQKLDESVDYEKSFTQEHTKACRLADQLDRIRDIPGCYDMENETFITWMQGYVTERAELADDSVELGKLKVSIGALENTLMMRDCADFDELAHKIIENATETHDDATKLEQDKWKCQDFIKRVATVLGCDDGVGHDDIYTVLTCLIADFHTFKAHNLQLMKEHPVNLSGYKKLKLDHERLDKANGELLEKNTRQSKEIGQVRARNVDLLVISANLRDNIAKAAQEAKEAIEQG